MTSGVLSEFNAEANNTEELLKLQGVFFDFKLTNTLEISYIWMQDLSF